MSKSEVIRRGIWIVLALTRLSTTAQVFVATTGTDSNSGTASQPVATLARAIELSRTLPAGQPRRIVLQPGNYFDTSVTLGEQDTELIVESEGPTRATLIGGVILSGWKKDGPRFWSAELPLGRDWDVRMLQINGRFCPRARLPETGTFTHKSVFNVPWMSTTGGGWKRKPTHEELTTLEYKDHDLPPDLDLRNAEITVFHMWDESVAGIVLLDVPTRTLKLSPPLGHPPGAFGVQKYCVWNIKEGMTRPGQWYFDRTHGRIVYWPRTHEDMKKAVAMVPTHSEIIRVAKADDVTIRNLNLALTTVPLITGGFAAEAFDGAIQLEGARGATLSNLCISNVAGQAIKGTVNKSPTRVIDCAISNCGAGGVYLFGPDNLVSNSVIHGVGLMFPSAMAINGSGHNCRLSHNEISDTTYSAIAFSGTDSLIENNQITDCMKVLHDGAAIYCSGSKHTVLRNNYAHDIVDTGGYGASAYYLDEQCQDCVVESNISLNVVRPSHNHMATNNIIRNNVFVSNGELRLTFPRCSGYRLEGNVLYARGKLLFEGVNNVAEWSRNVVYSSTDQIEATLLKDYSKTGDTAAVIADTLKADPQFKALKKLDLRYRAKSPAVKLGLAPLNISMAGRVGSQMR